MKILRQMSRFIYLWSLSLSFGTDVVVSTSVVRCDATAVLNKRREILFLDRPIWIIFQFHAKVAIGMDENNVFSSRRIFWDSFQWKLCVGSVCDVNYEWCFKWQFLKGGPAATNLRWNLWIFFCTLCQLNDEWDMFLNMGCYNVHSIEFLEHFMNIWDFLSRGLLFLRMFNIFVLGQFDTPILWF